MEISKKNMYLLLKLDDHLLPPLSLRSIKTVLFSSILADLKVV